MYEYINKNTSKYLKIVLQSNIVLNVCPISIGEKYVWIEIKGSEDLVLLNHCCEFLNVFKFYFMSGDLADFAIMLVFI